MATAAATPPPPLQSLSPPPPPPPPKRLNLESIARIDSTTLSQSELHALSLSSLSAFDLRSSHHHLVTPKIDPSQFNESIGSRRQTYSRPRRPESSPTGRRRRVAGPFHATKLTSIPADDSENVENRVIIDYLKQFIREDPKFDQVEFVPPSVPPQAVDHGGAAAERSELGIVNFGERKRKRGRKPKVKVHLDLEECYRGMEIVNKNGVAIDLAALAEKEDPFAEELRKRTEGLKGEIELLGFLSDLEGQWGSRRKKRRIVDAAGFGDVLPLGWKLLLGLKRKDGLAWIYCRRYMSPSGQQFVTCREVSSYLLSLLGNSDAQLQISYRSENMLREQGTTTGNSVGVTHVDQDDRQIVAINSDVPISSDSNERLKEVALLGLENLADVEIHDLFECHRCNMTFDDKDSYLQHLLSFHQKITRRYRLGSSVSDGVIIKDGKFECQFCHKVFEERRRYNCHVGIHVRNYVRRTEDSPGQESGQRGDKCPVREDIPSRLSKMDALIEIAQSSIMEDSVMEPTPEVVVGNLDQGMNIESPISEQQMEDSLTEKNVFQDFTQQDSPYLPVDGEVEEIDDDSQVIDATMIAYLDSISLLPENEQNLIPSETYERKDDVALSAGGFDQSGIVLEGASPHGPLLPSSGNQKIPESGKNENSGCQSTNGQIKLNEKRGYKNEMKFGSEGFKDVPVSTMVQEKGGIQFKSVDHEHDNVKGFQELGLDEIVNLEYDLASGQDSISLPDVQTDLVSNTVMQGTYASAVQIEPEGVMLNMDVRNQLKTLCVWCGVEFNHDAANSEIQPDSVGFMCPACKAKISGQIDVLDSGITEC